jgi:hypothetical protein
VLILFGSGDRGRSVALATAHNLENASARKSAKKVHTLVKDG